VLRILGIGALVAGGLAPAVLGRPGRVLLRRCRPIRRAAAALAGRRGAVGASLASAALGHVRPVLRRVGGLTGTALAAAAAAAPAPARTSCCAVAIVPAIVGTWPGWLGRRPAGGLGLRPAGQLGRLEDQDGRLERGRGYRLGSAGRPVAAPGGPRRGRLVAGNAWNGGHAGARRTRSGPAGRCLGRARCGVRARLDIRLVGGLAYGPAAPAQQAAPMAAFLTCGLTLAGLTCGLTLAGLTCGLTLADSL